MARYRKNKAMTFVELMVAMAISVIMMAATYYIAKSEFSAGQSQQEVMDALRTARLAIRYISNDIAAAGFMASPDLRIGPTGKPVDPDVCTVPMFPSGMRPVAVQLTRPDNSPYLGNYDHNIRPMSITLMGAYPSHLVFRTARINGKDIYLQNGPSVSFPTKTQFNLIFSTNHLLRIVNQNNKMLFFQITGRDYNAAKVTVKQSVPPASGVCGVAGFGRDLAVNAISFIRYRLRQRHDPNQPKIQNHYVLIREELNPFSNWAPVRTTVLPIADNAVDLQFYDFVFDKDSSGQDPDLTPFAWHPNPFQLPESVLMKGTSVPPIAAYLGTDPTKNVIFGPKDLRFLTVKLSIRTRDEDHEIDWSNAPMGMGPGNHRPIPYFDVDPKAHGLARVVSLLSKVELTNLAARNVK